MEAYDKEVNEKMKELSNVYFIIDTEIQSSLFAPWKRSFEKTGKSVSIINTEELAIQVLQSVKLGKLKRIFLWARRSKLKLKLQSILVWGFRPYHTYIVRRLNKQILEKINSNESLVFIFKGMDILPSTLETLRNKKVKLVSLNGDSHFNMESSNSNIIASAGLYDIVITWSEILERELKLKLNLSNTMFLPFSCEPIATPVKPDWLDYDLSTSLVFVGVWDQERELAIANLIQEDIVVFGPYWERRTRTFPANIKFFPTRITPSEMAYIYENSAACLNLMRSQNEDSHNMKTFEIPGYKGTMIAPRTTFHLELFKSSRSVFYYDKFSEIRAIFNKILSEEEGNRKADSIATNKFILREHTYDARMAVLLQKIKDL